MRTQSARELLRKHSAALRPLDAIDAVQNI